MHGTGAPGHDEARALIDRIGILRRAGDLDLLLFFTEHPSSLLPLDMLATFVGRNLHEVADSVEVLLSAGLLQRRQTAGQAARLFIFDPAAARDWLPALAAAAASRGGLLALRQALATRASESGHGDGKAR